jgi:ribosomal protein S18 acetylase RimI-like enzyme
MSIIVRKGNPSDSSDFAELFLMSDPNFFPFLFSPHAQKIVTRLFKAKRNLLSFEHSYFIETNGETAGMILGYNGVQKREEEIHTGVLLMKSLKLRFFLRLFAILKVGNVLGRIDKDEYYISNIAVYPKFRNRGFGQLLILEIEKEARKNNNKRIILEVKTDNKKAIKLYQRLGYISEKKIFIFKIKRKKITFLRMHKLIK